MESTIRKNRVVIHNVDHIVKFMDQFKLTQTSMGEMFGVSSSAVCGWLSDKVCPKWTQLAIEGLIRRKRAEYEKVVVICLPNNKDQVTALESFLKVIKIRTHTLNGPEN